MKKGQIQNTHTTPTHLRVDVRNACLRLLSDAAENLEHFERGEGLRVVAFQVCELRVVAPLLRF